MSEKKRVCVFYTLGLDNTRVLHGIRRAYADYEIVFLVPSDCPDLEAIGLIADVVQHTPHSRYPASRPLRLFSLIREIRSAKYDSFIVLFDSVKQRLLSSLSGCSVCECWGVSGRMMPLESNFFRVVVDVEWRWWRGWYRFAYIWCAIRLRPIVPRK